MGHLLKDQSVTVRYQDPDYSRLLQGIRNGPPASCATLIALTGAPKVQMQRAANELAASLGKPLHRVDLPTVTGTYIGETEKNLGRQLGRARASGAVLFFDEADALFGKRTGVKDSHDRYASLETGHLLDEVRRHRGLAIALFRSSAEAERRRAGWRQVVVRVPL
ncbi:MAG: hypothetical protein Rubg2KO_17850 [Rubricoccaceae bacterium]